VRLKISFLSVFCLQDDLNEVEQLLEKHSNFEKLVNTQEERFFALERLTTVILFFTICIQSHYSGVCMSFQPLSFHF